MPDEQAAFVRIVHRQTAHGTRQHTDSPHTHQRNRRVQHSAAGFADGCRQGTQPIGHVRRALQHIQHTLGSQRPCGKARLLQISGGATHHLFKYGIGNQVVIALFAKHQQIVRVEMKAQVLRKIRQPVHRCLQADQLPLLQQLIQPRLRCLWLAESFKAHAHAQRFLQILDDAARRHAVRHQRQPTHLDKGQIGKHQGRRQAKHHRL